MSALRPLARLALRDARHHPWRSALIVLLVALPVAAFTFGTIGMRTAPDSTQELRAKTIGGADALVQPRPGRAEAVAERLRQAGLQVTSWTRGSGVVRADRAGSRRMQVGLESIDPASPLARGLWVLRSGGLPAAAGEVLLSHAAAERLGVPVGGRLVLEEAGRSLRVSGIVDPPSLSTRVLVGPGLDDGSVPGGHGDPQLLVGGVDRDGDPRLQGLAVLQLFSDGVEIARPGWTDARTLLYMLGTLGLMAFGLVVAAAMAVGARRQLRVLGLLGAAGASPRQRSVSMLLHGGTLGAIGVAIGLPVGVAAWTLSRGSVEDGYGERIGPTVIDAGDLLLVALIALAVAIGASLLPARVAARTAVLQALGGRRPVPRVRPRVPVGGLALSVLGLALLAAGLDTPSDSGVPLLATAGVALAVIGTTITVPYLVGLLEGAAGGLRGTGRLAVRDVARHRGRTGPVVAAVMATGALAIAAGVVALSADDDARRSSSVDARTVTLMVSDPGLGQTGTTLPACDRLTVLARPIAQILPGATTACLQLFTADRGVLLQSVRPQDVDTLGLGARRADLEAGRVLGIGRLVGAAAPEQLTITAAGARIRTEVVPIDLTPALGALVQGGLLVDAATVGRRLPRTLPTAATLVYRAPAELSDLQRAALSALTDDLGLNLAPGATLSAGLVFDQGSVFPVGRLIYWVVLPVALLLSVLVVLVGLALVAVGAGPGHRRRMQAVRALVLAGMGQSLALPVGVACAWVVLRSQGIAFATPWPLLLALLALLPLAAAGIGAVLIRRDVPAATRRGT